MTVKETRVLEFSSLRSDWYATNSVLPRAVRQSVDGTHAYTLVGFPRQWIPTFEWFGVRWKKSIAPRTYIPFFSDFGQREIVRVVRRARASGMLRNLVEAASIHDSILSDFLYIVDNSCVESSVDMQAELDEFSTRVNTRPRRGLLLNGWQSYGRPSLRELERAVDEVEQAYNAAIALPCALARPYDRSRTHRRVYAFLRERGYGVENHDRVVISSLGVLPEQVWGLPQVLAYDAGVPDTYRILRLVRRYFGQRDYEYVIDALQFEPYSDVLWIVHREGLIREIRRLRPPGGRHFVLRPPHDVCSRRRLASTKRTS